MRKKQWICVLLALLLALTACGGRTQEPEEDGLKLWFPVDNQLAGYGHGPALGSQPYEGDSAPEAEELLLALLAGPTREGLLSPFPRGVYPRQCQWDEEKPGVLQITLSEQYGALADISLTLADYCIVLTLSQLEGVDAVELSTTQGYHISYRSHQLLSGEEAVLWDELADVAP